MRSLVAIAVVVFLATAAIAADTADVALDGGTFKVLGWKAPASAPADGWASVLTVYAGVGAVPPLLGSYAVENGTLVFRPQFPIAAGVQYRIALHVPGAPASEKTIDGPPRDTTPTAHVVQVYPTADVWPSNQLRLYIYFSAAMSRGEAAQYLHVLDENGKRLDGANGVLLPGEELWDPSFQRLTLTFDPGRIKRGLTSNQTIGPPIAEGKRYTLVIDRDWQDARGVPMTTSFQKTFRGGAAVRTPPDPATWHVTAPKAGTSAPLVVTFPEPMNYPLLQRMLEVADAKTFLDGSIDVDHHETEWRFTPRTPWRPGNYRLIIDTGIEDLAGNHIGQAFDIDVFEHVTEHIEKATVALPFAVN